MDFKTFLTKLYETESVNIDIHFPNGNMFYLPDTSVGHIGEYSVSADVEFYDGSTLHLEEKNIDRIVDDFENRIFRLEMNDGIIYVINY